MKRVRLAASLAYVLDELEAVGASKVAASALKEAPRSCYRSSNISKADLCLLNGARVSSLKFNKAMYSAYLSHWNQRHAPPRHTSVLQMPVENDRTAIS